MIWPGINRNNYLLKKHYMCKLTVLGAYVLITLIVIMFIIKVILAQDDVYGALDTDQQSRQNQIVHHN